MTIPKLDSAQIDILTKLLEDCESSGQHLISSRLFRKRHYDRIDVVERLIRGEFIRETGTSYFMNVTSFLFLHECEVAIKILKNAEKLWAQYRAHYTDHDSPSAYLSEIARLADVDEVEAKTALHYMMQTPWHNGYATAADHLYESIEVSEWVLKHKTFSGFLEVILGWQSDRQKQVGLVNLFPSSESISRGHSSPELPDWTNDLSEDLKQLLVEVLATKVAGHYRLAAMGVRALVDMAICETLGEDGGGFKAKLAALVKRNVLTQVQADDLGAMIETGNAASHRGHRPELAHVDAMLGIAFPVLQLLYSSGKKSALLRESTPKRPGLKPSGG